MMSTDINLRKAIDFIDMLSFCILAYIGFNFPERLIDDSLIILSIMLGLDLIYYTLEYIFHVYPKKVILLQIRGGFSFGSLIKLIPAGFLIAAGIINWSSLDIDSGKGLIFSVITFIKGLLYLRLKTSIRLFPDRLLFNGLFEKDLVLQEIKEIIVDSEKSNIKLCLIDNKSRLIKLNKEFFNLERQQVDKFVDSINNIA